eukprot:COSAG05_NODE_11291_length_520_cov_7.327948_1_plen_69_part_00
MYRNADAADAAPARSSEETMLEIARSLLAPAAERHHLPGTAPHETGTGVVAPVARRLNACYGYVCDPG